MKSSSGHASFDLAKACGLLVYLCLEIYKDAEFFSLGSDYTATDGCTGLTVRRGVQCFQGSWAYLLLATITLPT